MQSRKFRIWLVYDLGFAWCIVYLDYGILFTIGCPAAYNGDTIEDDSFLFDLQLHQSVILCCHGINIGNHWLLG